MFYQQGDVICEVLDKDIDLKSIKKIGKTLAEGERTGHYHATTKKDSFVYDAGTTLVLDAPTGTTIKHQEHKPISLPPGRYFVRKVKEYDHFLEEAREVRD